MTAEPTVYWTGAADARVLPSGVSVWAIIAYLRAADGDWSRVARDYDLSPKELCAARSCYEEHRAVIDAQIVLNDG